MTCSLSSEALSRPSSFNRRGPAIRRTMVWLGPTDELQTPNKILTSTFCLSSFLCLCLQIDPSAHPKKYSLVLFPQSRHRPDPRGHKILTSTFCPRCLPKNTRKYFFRGRRMRQFEEACRLSVCCAWKVGPIRSVRKPSNHPCALFDRINHDRRHKRNPHRSNRVYLYTCKKIPSCCDW